MTWLDIMCILGLTLVAAGGYNQGFSRGILRLATLVVGGLLGAGLMFHMGTLGTPRATAVWAVAAALLAMIASSLIAWSAIGAVPRRVHEWLPNRILGLLPALVVGVIILALSLSFAERVASAVDTQQLIRTGMVTGPLVSAVDLVEQHTIGVR
jgi:uncharacterized membrane protein required for colicin V production